MGVGGQFFFWLGASADAGPALVASDQAPAGFDPAHVLDAIEKHGAEARLGFVMDLMRVLGMRLRVVPK